MMDDEVVVAVAASVTVVYTEMCNTDLGPGGYIHVEAPTFKQMILHPFEDNCGSGNEACTCGPLLQG